MKAKRIRGSIAAAIVFAGVILQSGCNECSKPEGLSEKIRFTNGRHTKYYANGALQGEWSFKDDKLHGVGVEYHSNGKVKYQDFWVKGNLVSRQTYDENGVLVETFGKSQQSTVDIEQGTDK